MVSLTSPPPLDGLSSGVRSDWAQAASVRASVVAKATGAAFRVSFMYTSLGVRSLVDPVGRQGWCWVVRSAGGERAHSFGGCRQTLARTAVAGPVRRGN